MTTQSNENMLRTLTEKCLAGIYLVQDGRFCFVNTNAASYGYYEVDELIGVKSDSVIHPDDRAMVKANARAMLRGERQAPYGFRIIAKNGQIRSIMETVTPFFFNGKPALLGNSMDITDRMEAEERLRQSEILYRTIFETTGTATIIMEEDTTVALVNTEFELLSGAPKEYWEGKRKWTEIVHEKDCQRMLGYHHSRRIDPNSAPRNYEFSLVDKQGSVKEVLITIAMIPGTKRSVASLINISERRKAEDQLRQSEILYRTIFETTGTATIIVEEDTTVTLVNTEFEQLSGAPKEYWEGKRKWPEFVHEKDCQRMLVYHYNRRIDPNSAPRNYEFSLVDKQGSVKEVLITISMIPGTKQSVASFVNISERRKAEERLRESEVLYRTLFETTGTATIIVEEDTTISLVNTEFEKLSGASKDHWEGIRSWVDFAHKKDRERMRVYHHNRRIDPALAPSNYEFSFVDSKGNVKEVIITISMIPGTKKSVASFVDITERKKAEQDLKNREIELKDKTHELEELNAALRVLLKSREEDKSELENNVISSLNKLVMPYIEKMRRGHLKSDEIICLNVIESNLKDIASPFVSRLSSECMSFTPRELQVANLIKEGKTTKEISEFMNVSMATVEIHRYHIREKLGLNRKKTNLRTYLTSLK